MIGGVTPTGKERLYRRREALGLARIEIFQQNC
jgi:hypothetical protein